MILFFEIKNASQKLVNESYQVLGKRKCDGMIWKYSTKNPKKNNFENL